MSRCSAIWIFLSVSRRKAMKCCSHFASQYSADPPFVLGSGLDIHPDSSSIVIYCGPGTSVSLLHAICMICCLILPLMYSALAFAYALFTFFGLLLLVCLCSLSYLSANHYKHSSQDPSGSLVYCIWFPCHVM